MAEKLEKLLAEYENANSESFDSAKQAVHDYLGSKSLSEDELKHMRSMFRKQSEARTVRGKGRYLSGLGVMLLKYGNGSAFAKDTAVDLLYMVTNRSMSVKRYIGLEALASAPVYNGAKDEGKNLTTSFVEYLCNAVQSNSENAHFKGRSIEALASLYPRLVAAKRAGKKAVYRNDIKRCIDKIRETMTYVKGNKKRFGSYCSHAVELLK